MQILQNFGAVCRMIKIEHSIFALPFAYISFALAAVQDDTPAGYELLTPFLLLTVAMVAVRSFAMAFNRIVDLRIDAQNPRTQQRPLVTGEISPRQTWIFIAVMGCIFIAACSALNPLCFVLAPFALAVSAIYSLLKRITWLCHFWLGGVLGLAPLAGWISIDPQFTLPAVCFFFGILFWVAGFDIIYSCQDVDFDRSLGLYSVPAHFGVPTALIISTFCHVNTSLCYLLAGWSAQLGWPYFVIWFIASCILIWEHTIVSADDLSRANTAFFTLNGIIAPAMLLGVLAGLL